MPSKLPSMNILNFNGSLNRWLGFRDIFVSAIYKNRFIDNIQKLHYLRCSLKGEAVDIDFIPKNGNNYKIAWNTLEERYENKEIITFNYMQAMFNAPTLTKEAHVE